MHRALVLALLAAALSPSAAVPSVDSPASRSGAVSPPLRLSPEARDRFVAALAAFRSGDWSTAAREFKDRRWMATPLGEYALLFQAQSEIRLGDASAARAAALRAVPAATDGRLAPSALFEAATLISDAGDEATAVTLFRRFLDRNPDHRESARARLLLGQALLGVGRTSEAARVFSELWTLAPATLEAETAAEQLRVLVDRGLATTSPPRERVERAERLLAAGLAESAKSEAEALLGGELPSELRGRALKIALEVARRAGRHDAALATVKRALSTLPAERRASWLLDLARLQQRKSREPALGTLERLLREHPKSPEAGEGLLLKARLLEGGGKLTEASAVYRELAARHPDEEEAGAAIWRLGWLAWFAGNPAEAAGYWARVATMRGGQTYRDAAAYWLARADELRGEGELAARRFADVQAEAPRSYYGVLAAHRSGREVSARASTTVTLPEDPLEPLQNDAGYARIEALRAVGLEPIADDEMAELARRAIGEPRLLYAVSAAYAQESRYHLALRILRRHFFSLARSGTGAVPRAFWEMFYPLGWRNELMEAAAHATIDPLLVAAVVREESSFYPQARSRVGARGLMQLMPETARPMAQARGLRFNDGALLDEPGANLALGTAFLATLLREFGDARLAAAAYNAGPKRVREWWNARRSDDLEVWVEEIPFNETRAFVKRVMLSWDEYRRLYGASVAGARGGNGPR
jgi:soluble lytic murein transglycosylase